MCGYGYPIDFKYFRLILDIFHTFQWQLIQFLIGDMFLWNFLWLLKNSKAKTPQKF